MRGSIFPNGVRVDHSALRYTEISKADEILRGRVDWTSRGVLSGFEVTVNATDSTLIDVALGSGFDPSGNYIETTSDYFSISLDDYTLNAINYVCIVYTESNTYDQPHESNGRTYPTRAEMAWRVRVYEESNYNALSITDDNLANDARDRILLVAKVTANGAAVALTSNNITSPTTYSNILYANPSELTTITGVTITNVSPNTGSGTGSLSYTYAAGPTYTFTWTSAVGGVGTPVAVTTDGYYNFTDGLGEYIKCYIVLSQLPTTGSFPLIESITITNLYYQAIPRLTGEDIYHRNLTGTGIVGPNNPHGYSISDIAGDALPQLEEHQDVMHCNGIWRDSTTSVLITSVVTTPPTADTLNIQVPISSDLFYVNGNKLNSVNNSSIPFTPWQSDWGSGNDVKTNFFEIYVTDAGDVKAHRKATYPDPRSVRGTWIVDMSESYPAGNYNLSFVISGSNTIITWDNGVGVSLANADFGVAGNSRVIRLFDEEGVNWVDLWINMDDAKHGSDDDKFNNAVGPVTDSIEVTASLDWDANMQIASLVYWYDSTAPKGKLGYAPNTGTRRVIDKRPFGTLCSENMGDEALQNLIYHPLDELQYSGIILDRGDPGVNFRVVTTSALTMTIAGGDYYCRGQRLRATGDIVTLVDNVTNLVWLDINGGYNVIDVTTDYSGDIQAAMRYVLGGPSYIPNVDDDTHNTDTLDPPERGVLLYYAVTSSGSISYYEDYARNVNGPVDPWSVAQRSGASSVGRLAAFDSLNTAFDYAALYNKLNGVTIRIVGYTVVSNRRIVQPTGVVVEGGKHDTYNIVAMNFGHVDGTWALSQGCRVSNVNIKALVNNLAVFGLATASVASSDDVIVNGCVYNCGAYTTSSYFIRVSEAGFAGSSVDNVIIRDNTVTVGVGFLSYDTTSIDYNNFVVSGNNIYLLNTGVFSLALALYCNATGSGIRITNNYFNGSQGVFLRNFTECDVSHNIFELGNSAGNPVIGVYAYTVTKSAIESNIFAVATGNTSTSMTAIKTNDLISVSISSNKVTNYHYGIYDAAATTSAFLSINGNTIIVIDNGASAGGVGIFTYAVSSIISNNYVYGEADGIGCGPSTGADEVKIIGNTIRLVTKNGGTLNSYNIGGSSGCSGIAVAIDSIDIDVENNRVDVVGDSGVIASNSAGIYMNDVQKFTIKGNTLSANGTSLGGGSAWHLYAAPKSNSNFIISNNKIDNRSGLSDPSPMQGLFVIAGSLTNVVGKVNSNLIDGSNDTGDSNNEFYVVVTGGGSFIIVTENVISDLTIGGATQPLTNITGSITQNDNALINSTGFLANI